MATLEENIWSKLFDPSQMADTNPDNPMRAKRPYQFTEKRRQALARARAKREEKRALAKKARAEREAAERNLEDVPETEIIVPDEGPADPSLYKRRVKRDSSPSSVTEIEEVVEEPDVTENDVREAAAATAKRLVEKGKTEVPTTAMKDLRIEAKAAGVSASELREIVREVMEEAISLFAVSSDEEEADDEDDDESEDDDSEDEDEGSDPWASAVFGY